MIIGAKEYELAKPYSPRRGPYTGQQFSSEYQYRKQRSQDRGFASPREQYRAQRNQYYWDNLSAYQKKHNIKELEGWSRLSIARANNQAQLQVIKKFNEQFVKNQLVKRSKTDHVMPVEYLISIGVLGEGTPLDYVSPEKEEAAA